MGISAHITYNGFLCRCYTECYYTIPSYWMLLYYSYLHCNNSTIPCHMVITLYCKIQTITIPHIVLQSQYSIFGWKARKILLNWAKIELNLFPIKLYCPNYNVIVSQVKRIPELSQHDQVSTWMHHIGASMSPYCNLFDMLWQKLSNKLEGSLPCNVGSWSLITLLPKLL